MVESIDCVHEHEFVLVLDGVKDLTVEVMDALYEAGCDDATPSLRFGKVYLGFTRSAPTLREAILSAVRQVREAKIGAEVERVDHCELVSQADIARRIGRSRQSVQLYIAGKRGPGGFPAPIRDGEEGTLWEWSPVAKWLQENHLVQEREVTEATDKRAINLILALRHLRHDQPSLYDEITTELIDSLLRK